jgi:hypothetical protein
MKRIKWFGLIFGIIVSIGLCSYHPGQAAVTIAAWQCWGPEYIDPCLNRLNDITAVPGTNGDQVWAVGDAGTILYWADRVWQRVPGPVSADLLGISMISQPKGGLWVKMEPF